VDVQSVASQLKQFGASSPDTRPATLLLGRHDGRENRPRRRLPLPASPGTLGRFRLSVESLQPRRRNSASKPDTNADNVAITVDRRSRGRHHAEPVIGILGALCAALDPGRRPHQAQQANTAHNPALFIRWVMFS
jgi:hypothetical protein